MDQKILSRKQARSRLGGCSTMTLVRLEQAGKLTPIKLTDKPTSKTYYESAEIDGLIEARMKRGQMGKSA